MKRLAAILLLAGCAHVPDSGPDDPIAEIWSEYADGIDGAEVSVALVRDGIPAFAGDPKAIYRLGDFTEFFVLESARKLEERGVIDLDRPLTAFARFAIDPLYGKITMRRLAALESEPISADNTLAFLSERYPWVSDARFALFTALLENAVGRPVDEIVRDEVVLPLQLHDTSFTPSADKSPRVMSRAQSLDGIYSSVEDCVKLFASSEHVRSSVRLRQRRAEGDVKLDCAVGHALGGRRFVAYPQDGRDFLLVFRNQSSWLQNKDFEFASKMLAR